MLALSSKVGYALSAMYELARGEQGVPIQIRVISKRHTIPQHYLEQVLVVLKQHGFVRSVRGAAGGYMLACDPVEIRVLDVITCLEGGPSLVQKDRKEDPLYDYWIRCEGDLKRLFADTLRDLIEEWGPAAEEKKAEAEAAREVPVATPAPTNVPQV